MKGNESEQRSRYQTVRSVVFQIDLEVVRDIWEDSGYLGE